MAEYLKGVGKKEKRPGDELKRLLTEIRLGEKEQEKYIEKADKVVKRYRDEDRDSDIESAPARFNILWSNTETTGPLYFSRVPQVQVARRFKDADPVGRTACQIWERSGQFAIDNYDFRGLLQSVVKDFQLVGRGTAWVRYEPTVADDQITYQEVLADHVHYKDFGHSPSKQWRNVRGVWRKIYLTKKQLKARFPDIWQDIPVDYSPTDSNDGEGRKTQDQKEYQQARIYEYWDADSMCVYWVSKNYSRGVLDKLEDPLGLHDFFPTPKPLFGVTTTETLVPIPDYCLYQDQAKELDRITMKIALLQDALRMVGFFDATYAKDLKQLYQGTRVNEMIPIANWQKLQSAGGIQGIAEWMSIKEIIEALGALHMDRDKVKQDLYEITGIGDIIRGANSGQQVTATEQAIKGRFASIRIEERKTEVQRYARDLIALQMEIIAEHFEPQMIAAMSGMDISSPETQQLFIPAIELLKNDPIRSFRIELETDSMAAVDDALDKQKTTEFVEAFTQLLTGTMQVIQGAPMLAPVLGEVMMHTVRRFNGGRGLEESIEQGMQGLAQMAQQSMSQPPAPDPNVMKVQAQIQLEQTKSQNDFQLKQAELAQKAQLHQADIQGRLGLETEKNAQELQIATQKNAQEIQVQRERNAAEIQLKREVAQLELNLRAQEMQMANHMEARQQIIAGKIPNIHMSADGAITTHPTIIKTGKFGFDENGQRTVTVIEKPVGGMDVEGEEAPTRVKMGTIRVDPVTGERTIEMIDQPVKTPAQAGMTGAQMA